DFARFATQDSGGPFARCVKRSPGLAPDMMNARRIAKDLVQEGQHRLANQGIQRCRGVVIEVDRAHGTRIDQTKTADSPGKRQATKTRGKKRPNGQVRPLWDRNEITSPSFLASSDCTSRRPCVPWSLPHNTCDCIPCLE